MKTLRCKSQTVLIDSNAPTLQSKMRSDASLPPVSRFQTKTGAISSSPTRGAASVRDLHGSPTSSEGSTSDSEYEVDDDDALRQTLINPDGLVLAWEPGRHGSRPRDAVSAGLDEYGHGIAVCRIALGNEMVAATLRRRARTAEATYRGDAFHTTRYDVLCAPGARRALVAGCTFGLRWVDAGSAVAGAHGVVVGAGRHGERVLFTRLWSEQLAADVAQQEGGVQIKKVVQVSPFVQARPHGRYHIYETPDGPKLTWSG